MNGVARVLPLALCLGCLGEASIVPEDPNDGPEAVPGPTAQWIGETARFTWKWGDDVDAFNVIAARDGAREAQRELGGTAREVDIAARGARVVTVDLQACNKGIFASSCTPWARGSSSR